MNFKSIIIVSLSLVLLSGCVVRPAHHTKKVKVVAPVKVVSVLDNEHQSRDIVIINIKPEAKRNCWVHSSHWHCHR